MREAGSPRTARRFFVPLVAALALAAAGASPAAADWTDRIDGLVAGRAVSVSVGRDGTTLYRHRQTVRRTPASNEKLLLSMALMARLDPAFRIETSATAPPPRNGVVRGNLWINGHGDPEIGPARLGMLAKRIKAAGVRRIRGSVVGSTRYFKHDWWARGWKSYFPRRYIPLPTALTFNGNTAGGVHITDPERRAAAELTGQLERRGVAVRGRPRAGAPKADRPVIAVVKSAPLSLILTRQNRYSRNFYAEVLGKLLGVLARGEPGTIGKGARSLEAWAASNGAKLEAHDSSGLSYKNRVTTAGVVRLLTITDAAEWGERLRNTLPEGGQGTLEHRLKHVRLHAKTGTLTGISALSGWVWLKRAGEWAEFSILSRGMSKTRASAIEDSIVRIVSARAR